MQHTTHLKKVHIHRALLFAAGTAVVLLTAHTVYAGLPLETETARPAPRHTFGVSSAFEFQTSKEGTEKATPLALEYGVTDRMELLVEPVFYTAIRHKTGPHATGMGDLETTLNYLILTERPTRPAVSIAGEIKFPTARNVQIGTSKTDFAGYLVASKHVGNFDTHANLSYTIVGQPAGQALNNLIGYAAAVEFHLNPRWNLVCEAYGNSSALAETQDVASATGESTFTPEASGGELVGMLGARYYLQPTTALTLGVSYDNSHALLVAPGVVFNFK